MNQKTDKRTRLVLWLALFSVIIMGVYVLALLSQVSKEVARANAADARAFQERYYAEQRCGLFILNNSKIENGELVLRMPLFLNATVASEGGAADGN